MIRSAGIWLAGAWFSRHWLLGAAGALPVAWLAAQRWPAAFWKAAALGLGLGLVIGQGLEPLSEMLLYPGGANPFQNALRWRVLGEFVVAALGGFAVGALLFGPGAGPMKRGRS